jgi:hypothetical protein
MLAHLSLRAYRAKLILIGKPTDTGGRFVEIGPDFFEALPEMQEGLMVPIDDAIQAMERAQDAG